MLENNSQNKKTLIRISLANLTQNELKKLLESYEKGLNLDEVVALIENDSLDKEIHYAAYLYLVNWAELPTLQKLAPKMNFDYRDSDRRTTVLVAAKRDNIEVLKWLKTLGIPFDVKNRMGMNAVLTAAANGKKEVFRELTKPLSQGGLFGLPMDSKNKTGDNAVLLAAFWDELEMLQELIKPLNQGGFGFSSDVLSIDKAGLVERAIQGGSVRTLQQLVKPLAKGGLGLSFNSNDRDPIIAAIRFGKLKILEILVKSKHKGGFGLSLNVKDSQGRNPVLTAIRCGHIDILKQLIKPKSQGGFGLSLDVKDCHGRGPVLTAIYGEQIDILQLLVKPENEGGAGLSLDVRDINNQDALLTAIAFGKLETMRTLVKSKNQGGFGLAFNIKDNNRKGPLWTAIANERFDLVQHLIKPQSEEGFGCSLEAEDVDEVLNIAKEQCQKTIFHWVFMSHFDKLVIEKGFTAAKEWADNTIKKLDYCIEKNSAGLIARYKKLIFDYLSLPDLAQAEVVVNALEELSPGEGYVYLASNYYLVGKNDLIEGGLIYLHVFKNENCSIEMRQKAGYELANLIFNGDLILCPNGSLDEEKTNARLQVSDENRQRRSRSESYARKSYFSL